MSDTQIIAASLTVNSDDAVKNVLKLKGTVEDLKKELKNAKAGSDEQVAAFKRLKTAQEDLAKANKQLNEANKETTGHFSKLKEGINSLPGATGAAGRGVEGLNVKFKALLANPIGLILTAIVLVLTALYKAFTNTFEGGEKVEQIFAGIKAAGQALLDNIGKIGSALVKFFTFDFSGAVKEIKGVADAAANAYGQMAKLTKQAQDLAREQADNDLDQAKRQAKLAELRAKAADGEISAAERKKAARELLEESKKNAEADLDLADRVAKNKIAKLELEQDGKRKNYIEIKKIEAEQIQNATANSNELKQIAKQLTAAEREEIAEKKAADQKAAEEAKKRKQELIEFTNKLTKLQQDNELALIKDSYQKELKQLKNKVAEEKKANQITFQDKKITLDQLNQLNAALDEQANIQRDAITDKHNKEIEAKEVAFQKNIEDLKNKIRLSSIKDGRELEKAQLQFSYEEQLKKTIELYKDNQQHFQEAKRLIDDQYRIDQQKLNEKYAAEDAKKALALEEQKQKDVLTDPQSSIEQRQAAIDAEQALFQQAFDNKVLTEVEYNNKVKELSAARMTIDELEAQNKIRTFELISNGLNAFADLIGKNTAAGKAAAVAATLINTYQAAWSVFANAAKNPASIPFPAFPYIQAGLAIVAGLKTVQSIIKTPVPGGGGGGSAPSAPSISPTAPLAPTPQNVNTTLDQNSINNIGNAAAGGVNAVRAYVVESDVSDTSERMARLNRASVLGG